MPVLDAHALLAYLEREEGFAVVRDLCADALKENASLHMTTVNFGEVLYIVRRERGAAQATEIERLVRTLPIALVDADLDLVREAARFKAAGKMSYADCFAAALASLKAASLVTGDPEFEAVAGEIDLIWIRSTVGEG